MLSEKDLMALSGFCDMAIRQGGAQTALIALPIMGKLRQMMQQVQMITRPVSMPRPNGSADETQPSM